MAALDLRSIVASNIRRFAEERGITLNALADFADVSRAQLFDVLGGTKDATTDWLAKIAPVLEVEPWELLRPPDSRP